MERKPIRVGHPRSGFAASASSTADLLGGSRNTSAGPAGSGRVSGASVLGAAFSGHTVSPSMLDRKRNRMMSDSGAGTLPTSKPTSDQLDRIDDDYGRRPASAGQNDARIRVVGGLGDKNVSADGKRLGREARATKAGTKSATATVSESKMTQAIAFNARVATKSRPSDLSLRGVATTGVRSESGRLRNESTRSEHTPISNEIDDTFDDDVTNNNGRNESPSDRRSRSVFNSSDNLDAGALQESSGGAAKGVVIVRKSLEAQGTAQTYGSSRSIYTRDKGSKSTVKRKKDREEYKHGQQSDDLVRCKQGSQQQERSKRQNQVEVRNQEEEARVKEANAAALVALLKSRTIGRGTIISRQDAERRQQQRIDNAGLGISCLPLFNVRQGPSSGRLVLQPKTQMGPFRNEKSTLIFFVVECESGRLKCDCGSGSTPCYRQSNIIIKPNSTYCLKNESSIKIAELLTIVKSEGNS